MLWYKKQKNDKHTLYVCLAPLNNWDNNQQPLTGYIAVAHADFLEPKGEYKRWLDAIEIPLGINRVDGFWEFKETPYWQVHLAFLLARGPYEDSKLHPPREGAINTLMDLYPDPLQAWTYVSSLTPQTIRDLGFVPYSITAHGLWGVAKTLERVGLNIRNLCLVSAWKKMEKGKYGINDRWRIYDDFVGYIYR